MALQRILTLAVSLSASLLWTLSIAQATVTYQDPAGGWNYTYDGTLNPGVGGRPDGYGTDNWGIAGALDGTWSHNQGDKWDGTAPGDPLSNPLDPDGPVSTPSGGKLGTSPGGAGEFTESGVDYIRLQDTGNPGVHGWCQCGPSPITNTNRRVVFGHDMVARDGIADQLVMTSTGITVSFRARIPNSGPLDALYSVDDGDDPDTDPDVIPWLQETTENELPITNGRGAWMDNGRGMINIVQNGAAQDDTLVGFSLVNSTDVADFKAANSSGSLMNAGSKGGLIMNNLNGNVPTDSIDSLSAGSLNMLEMDDSGLSEWNDFWITLKNNDALAGNIEVSVYMNGSETPDTFQVTLAAPNNANYANENSAFLEFGLGTNDGYGSFDMDYLSYKIGVFAPEAATITADVNDDGMVDGTDFLQIQRTDASLIPLWQSQYGTSPATASFAGVPEPGSLLLMALSAVGLAASRRRW